MKMKKYQLLCACIAFIGAIALGFALFAGSHSHLAAVYICSGITLLGILGNAVFAFLQLDSHPH
ncbi:MAG: hypothetical protein E7463_10880 [Ruminococcaceae bacterium]|nr:hypothetical protein [Oscillospiraceae bacterium]